MVKYLKHIILFIGLSLSFGTILNAQEVDAFTRVSVSPRQGVVRQAYKVNISVYSSTWFTESLQFSNLRIEDAFIIPFTRTQSSISYINKKKYATLTFYYLVYPYHSGDLIIPEIAMSTSIPPEGGYKGVATTIKTKPQKIQVTPIPETKEEVWLVAKSAYITEKWNKPTTSLKVGDVIQRTITIRANGTLPSLIPPLNADEIHAVSMYPSTPILQDKRDDDNINGVRIESYSYLFEKEGNITIPEEEVAWWNPDTKKVYKRVLPEQTLTILPNPDLAMLQSIKDSLDTLNAPAEGELTQATYPWKRTLILGVLILASLWIVYSMTKRELHRALVKREAYLKSESYFFKRIKTAAKSADSQSYVRELYTWFDRIRKEETTLRSYLNANDRVLLNRIIQVASKNANEKLQKKELLSLAKSIRKAVLTEQTSSKADELNP